MRLIILLSDSTLFARTVARLLDTIDAEMVVECATRATFDAATRALRAERIVVDLADARGREALQAYAALKACADVPIACVLDSHDEPTVETLLAAGAAGVIIKSATPQALAAAFELIMAGESCRPAPPKKLPVDAIPAPLRAQLNGREQKLLRSVLGGTAIDEIARSLGMTEAKVVQESRRLNALLRGQTSG